MNRELLAKNIMISRKITGKPCPYEEGAEAFYCRIDPHENPYCSMFDFLRHEQWFRGWEDAEYEEMSVQETEAEHEVGVDERHIVEEDDDYEDIYVDVPVEDAHGMEDDVNFN